MSEILSFFVGGILTFIVLDKFDIDPTSFKGFVKGILILIAIAFVLTIIINIISLLF